MRRLAILVPLLAAVTLAAACSRSETPAPASEQEETPPPPAAPPPPTPEVRDTIRQGQAFELGFPNTKAARACIRIPADAVPAGTEVRVTLVTASPSKSDWPPAFRKASNEGWKVYPPIYEFSANPAIDIQDPAKRFTIGVCAERGTATDEEFANARLAHPDPGAPDSLQVLDLADPCQLVCGKSAALYPQQGALAPVERLLAGSPLSPTPLSAAMILDGIGGKGGSLSPFAAVSP